MSSPVKEGPRVVSTGTVNQMHKDSALAVSIYSPTVHRCHMVSMGDSCSLQPNPTSQSTSSWQQNRWTRSQAKNTTPSTPRKAAAPGRKPGGHLPPPRLTKMTWTKEYAATPWRTCAATAHWEVHCAQAAAPCGCPHQIGWRRLGQPRPAGLADRQQGGASSFRVTRACPCRLVCKKGRPAGWLPRRRGRAAVVTGWGWGWGSVGGGRPPPI